MAIYTGANTLVVRTILTIYYYNQYEEIKAMPDIEVAGALSFTGAICVNMDMKAVAVVPSGAAVKVRLKKDRQTDRKKDRQKDRKKDRKKEKRKKDRQKERQTERQTERKTERKKKERKKERE